MVILEIGKWCFEGRLELAAAPNSVAWLLARLPLKGVAFHARWSGEAAWIPIERTVTLDFENSLSYPRPGQILLYAGTQSDPELLLPYGFCAFASRAGMLAGNHVITLECEFPSLSALGHALLFNGALPYHLCQSADK